MLVAMMVEDEHGKGQRSQIPSLLRYNEQYETSSTQQTRSKGGKVTTNTVRNNVVRRVDVGAEIVVMKLAVAQFTKGEFESWIALKEGILFDPLPKGARQRTRRTWHVIPPPAKSATPEQAARHYGYTEASVIRMDQQARKILNALRDRAGLTRDIPSVPIWPAVCTDENLLRHLYARDAN